MNSILFPAAESVADRMVTVLQHGLQLQPHALGYEGLRLQIGVDSVGLHEFTAVADAVHQGCHQWCSGFLCELVIDGMESFCVASAVVGRQMNTEQQAAGPAAGSHLDHRGEVLFQLGQREAAQAVVAAQLQYHDAGLMGGEGARQASESGGRCVPADAGIHQPEWILFRLQALLQQRHPAGIGGYSVGGAQAVADQQDGVRLAGPCRTGNEDSKNEENTQHHDSRKA